PEAPAIEVSEGAGMAQGARAAVAIRHGGRRTGGEEMKGRRIPTRARSFLERRKVTFAAKKATSRSKGHGGIKKRARAERQSIRWRSLSRQQRVTVLGFVLAAV